MQKSREGYGKNWMHFVYKLNNLFRSIRVQTKTHLLQRPALHFFKLIASPNFFCVQYAPFKATSSTFNPFWHNLLFLITLLICFELNGPAIEKVNKWTLKRLKLGMVSSFHPHSMCKKGERVTAKTGCTSCANWTISFEVSGFQTSFRMKPWYFERDSPFCTRSASSFCRNPLYFLPMLCGWNDDTMPTWNLSEFISNAF